MQGFTFTSRRLPAHSLVAGAMFHYKPATTFQELGELPNVIIWSAVSRGGIYFAFINPRTGMTQAQGIANAGRLVHVWSAHPIDDSAAVPVAPRRGGKR